MPLFFFDLGSAVDREGDMFADADQARDEAIRIVCESSRNRGPKGIKKTPFCTVRDSDGNVVCSVTLALVVQRGNPHVINAGVLQMSDKGRRS